MARLRMWEGATFLQGDGVRSRLLTAMRPPIRPILAAAKFPSFSLLCADSGCSPSRLPSFDPRSAQVVDTATKKEAETSLVEVGPRFCLQLIRMFNGSFGGSTLYENPEYESPNEVWVCIHRPHPLLGSFCVLSFRIAGSALLLSTPVFSWALVVCASLACCVVARPLLLHRCVRVPGVLYRYLF